MLLDRRDLELLHLVGRYRWLPYGRFDDYGLSGLDAAVRLLAHGGLVSISRNKEYLKLTPGGLELLDRLGYAYDAGTKKAYSGSSALRRRLEVAHIMLACLRAGIDVAPGDSLKLSRQPTYLPAFVFKKDGNHQMSSATCAAFGSFGNTGYMFHYVGPLNRGMLLTIELGYLSGLAAIFSSRIDRPRALIFSGDSYQALYRQLRNQQPSKRHGKRGFKDYWHVYRYLDLPIHLMACNEIGAMQLAIMRMPDYRSKIALTAAGYGDSPDSDIPELDGFMNGKPLIIAVDMDIRRVLRVYHAAREQGHPEILVAALPAQIEEVLREAVPQDGAATFLKIEMPVLKAAFGKDFSLYTPGRAVAAGPTGGLIYA